MKEIIRKFISMAASCSCGNQHFDIPFEEIVVERDALQKCVLYIREKALKKTTVIADDRTFNAAGKAFCEMLGQEGIENTVCFISGNKNGDVIADEASVVQALIGIPGDTDVLIAVGSGTINDITRFCSSKLRKPFISILTAASVDGYTSMGAPLIIRGDKKTIHAVPPIAIFADIDILKNAPRKMTAAGFGDVLGKITSLTDWRFCCLVGGEPYCPVAAHASQEALENSIRHIDDIAKGEEKGIRILMHSLILSGISMLLFGQTRPASGGEHHLAHHWEVEFLKTGRPQVLHGAKVSVAMLIISDLYKRELKPLLENVNRLDGYVRNDADRRYIGRMKENREELLALLEKIPPTEYLRGMIEKVGGETAPEMLGIERELVLKGLREAHLQRDRFTMLKFLNQVIRIEHKD